MLKSVFFVLAFFLPACGAEVAIPVEGGAVYTYPAFSGEEACAQ